MEQTELKTNKTDTGKRLDRYLCYELPEISRSRISALISDEHILVNGSNSKPSYKIKDGDIITVNIPDPVPDEVIPEDIPLSVLYEDNDLLVVEKPSGMNVHPGAGHINGTLVNALLYHCGDSLSGINGVMRPGIVHRIDMDTSGCLIVCKNDNAHAFIAKQLEEHTVKRLYRGIICGIPGESSGTVDKNIGRNPKDRKKMACVSSGKRAVTHYRILETFRGYCYAEFRLETGRTHQIRVHMASIGHPLLGDPLYGRIKSPFKTSGQMLHAMTIGFIHPSTGEYMEFESPLPEEFEAVLKRLRNEYKA